MATSTVRPKSAWYCSECGHRQVKWSGQCTSCQSWNTLHEEVEQPRRFEGQRIEPARPVRLSEAPLDEPPRYVSGIEEFDRLLGGGVVIGSLSLIAGDPGIGKSTLLLQLASALARKGLTVLYVCGEESVAQVSSRAKRLGITGDSLYFLSETNYSFIKAQVDAIQPHLLIVDSIQIVFKSDVTSSPGSVTQVRETATEFMHLAKGQGIATFLVGHVTKGGEIAGPRVLEHLVDTVLYFEGDRQQNYRMVRVVKNRFGPTDEIAVFQMSPLGLSEVANPSEIFLEERVKEASGSAIVPALEGSRPILVEVQALVAQTGFATPSRRSAGIDPNRLALLLGVMEKRLNFRLHGCDVFVSVVGGLRISEPSVDLGIVLAVASSFCNKRLPPDLVCVGEVGLGGEIRSVPRIDSRIKEALRMGFRRCIVPRRNLKGLPEVMEDVVMTGVDLVEEAINAGIN